MALTCISSRRSNIAAKRSRFLTLLAHHHHRVTNRYDRSGSVQEQESERRSTTPPPHFPPDNDLSQLRSDPVLDFRLPHRCAPAICTGNKPGGARESAHRHLFATYVVVTSYQPNSIPHLFSASRISIRSTQPHCALSSTQLLHIYVHSHTISAAQYDVG